MMRVIVAGGGVAGAVTAIALAKRGADVTIFEAYADPGGEVGSFLSIAANGLRGLAAIDVLDRVRARGFCVARQRMWASSGALLGDLPRGRLSADPLHSVTLMRADLVDELRTAAEESGVRVVTGERLAGATHQPDGVRATFASGTAVDADLLVGADGIWSTTRTILDPAAPAPAYAGLYSVSGVSRGIELDGGVFNLVFARNGAFIYLRAANGDVWWQAQVNSAGEPDRDGVDGTEWLRRLSTLYKYERVPAAIIDATVDVQRPTVHHVLDRLPVWSDRHIVLVGDAAHPVGAGQGASMAIEDGLSLATALAGTESIPAALIAYYERRGPRLARMATLADDNRGIKTAGAVRRGGQRLLMPIFLRLFYEKATAWLYSYDLTTDPPLAASLRSAGER